MNNNDLCLLQSFTVLHSTTQQNLHYSTIFYNNFSIQSFQKDRLHDTGLTGAPVASEVHTTIKHDVHYLMGGDVTHLTITPLAINYIRRPIASVQPLCHLVEWAKVCKCLYLHFP